MGYTVPTSEPAQLRAGDTWQWRREDLSADYPASLWTLTYYVRNAAAHFDVVAAADGDAFAVSVAKATTGAYSAGWYDWYAFVSNATERYQIASGRLNVLADVATAAAFDGRCFARQMVDYIDAALLNRASADQLDLINSQLDGRGLSRDRDSLLVLRSKMEIEAKREEQANPGKTNRLVVRFT